MKWACSFSKGELHAHSMTLPKTVLFEYFLYSKIVTQTVLIPRISLLLKGITVVVVAK